jgi:tetratricopeptide (TPR) repeat protein
MMPPLALRAPAVALALLALLAALVSAPVEAQRDRDRDDEQAEEAPTIDANTGKILNQAIEALNAEQFAEADAAIATLDFERLSPYERSRTEQVLASIAHFQEDYRRAQTHLQRAVDAGGLNAQEVSQARYQIAQIYMVEEKWAEGAAALEEWFATAENPNSGAYYLLAVAYYQQELFDRALPPAERALELAEMPQESWLQLVLALRLQREQYRESVPLLEQLIALKPDNRNYWLQLSSIYGQVDDDYPRALAAMQAAYAAGVATEDADIRRLADLLVFNGVPYRGAETLAAAIADGRVERDLPAYEKLANSWISAGEYDRALEPLEAAAERAPSGDLYVRLGEVHLQQERWEPAVAALERGIEKGELADRGKAELLIGVAMVNQERYEQARPWLQRASATPNHRNTARSYLQFIDAQGGRS